MALSPAPVWTSEDAGAAPAPLRPLHVLLVAFVMTVPVSTPTLASFADAPQFGVLEDTFVFAELVAALAASVVMVVREGRETGRRLSRESAVTIAGVVYGVGVLGFVALALAPTALPLAALLAGVLAGAGLPVLVAAWARVLACPMDRALALCAFVLIGASFGGWLLTLLPLHVLTPLYAVLLAAGIVPLPSAVRVVASDADAVPSKGALRRLASVTWLPLLGLAAYAFMTAVMAHSAFGVMSATFLGGAGAAVLVFGVCYLWGKRPLLPWCYRMLVPLLAAAFVVLGAFPAETVPKELSVVALYLFYLVLAALACALFLAVVRARELPAGAAVGFGTGVVAAAALLGQILAQVLRVTDDFAPWLTVLTGAFIAVLLVFLGRTAWDELVEGDASAPSPVPADASMSHGTQRKPAASDASLRDSLEARCRTLAEQYALSPREAELLGYLARGFSPTYIAKELVLSVSTVRTHVRNIYRKLGIGKREELIHLVDETDR